MGVSGCASGCHLSILWMLRADDCAYAKMTSGRLLIGVDIMPGFKCNDRFFKSTLLHSDVHMHTRTHERARTQLLEHLAVKAYLQKSQ